MSAFTDTGKFAYTLAELHAAGLGGRTKLYEDLNKGLLRAKKNGRRTIVLHEDAKEYAKSLPDYVPRANAAAGAEAVKPDPEQVVEQVEPPHGDAETREAIVG